MSSITAKDGTTIYYKDWGHAPGRHVSHGWPLNSDCTGRADALPRPRMVSA